MRIWLAAAPEELNEAKGYTSQLAHAAYRIGEDGTLLAKPLPNTLRGGLMLVTGGAERLPEDTLCRELMRRCLQHGFSGIILDLDAQCGALIRKTERLARQYGRRLYVPEAYADASESATILICTALSGGSLQQRLEQAAARFGAARIALDLQRLAMDFPLPCPGGMGTPLSIDQLHQLMGGHAVYFSDGLCAHYFTHRQSGSTHFVLFDDADTLRRKMEMGQQLGISEGFVMFPETADILPQLFSAEEKERS